MRKYIIKNIKNIFTLVLLFSVIVPLSLKAQTEDDRTIISVRITAIIDLNAFFVFFIKLPKIK